MTTPTGPIGRTAFFAGIDPKLLKTVEESAVARNFQKSEVIVREGEIGPGMYVITRGRVEVTKRRYGSRVAMAELGPEQFFAETSLVDDKPHSASVTALDETECLLFRREIFVELMSRNPQLAIRLARSLAERLRNDDDRSPLTVADSGSNASCEPSGKAAIEQGLLNVFGWMYTVKAFTRFSVALLGCPVEGSAVNMVEEIRVGEVKALIVPSGEKVEMLIRAYDAGSFRLHVFTPESPAPVRFRPVDIRRGDRFLLRLPNMDLAAEYSSLAE